ncbi:MAG TPA: ABC transporter permease [Solirubrobacterales bacterium]|jgi:ABC-2 type transport system permease protein|nr:ABC transporter permease [Solirubrobacterales bacterium]
MSDRSLLASQFRCDLRIFWRSPQSRYFTVLLPIVFLVIFAAIFKGTTVVDGQTVKITTYYVPAIMTLGIISASFVNLTQAIVAQRESGVLKRARATPVPASVVIASRAAVGVVVALVMSALLLVIGRLAYGVRLPGSTMPGLIIAVVIGAAAFCCMGFAVSTRVSAADAAAPVTNLIVLPLYFISGVFVPEDQIPSFLRHVADIFPIRHLAQALQIPFVHTHGAGIAAGDLLIVAAWGVAALAVAARTFQWSPRTA